MKKRKDTRERILMQALSYFTEQDYERISLNDIAGALGITKGGIYHYFGSKDELFREALLFTVGKIETQFDEMMGTWTEGGSAVPLDRILRRFFNLEEFGDQSADSVGVDVYKEYENLVYLLFVGLKKFPELRTRIDEVYSGQMDRLKDLLDRAQHTGEIREELDTQALALEVISLVEGLLLVGGLVRSISLEEMSGRIFEHIWNRIRKEGA